MSFSLPCLVFLLLLLFSFSLDWAMPSTNDPRSHHPTMTRVAMGICQGVQVRNVQLSHKLDHIQKQQQQQQHLHLGVPIGQCAQHGDLLRWKLIGLHGRLNLRLIWDDIVYVTRFRTPKYPKNRKNARSRHVHHLNWVIHGSGSHPNMHMAEKVGSIQARPLASLAAISRIARGDRLHLGMQETPRILPSPWTTHPMRNQLPV